MSHDSTGHLPDPLADLARLEGVPSALASTRDAVDAVLVDRGLRQVSSEQRAEALLASARASAELEQQLGGPDDLLEPTLRLYAELSELATRLRASPPQVLARAHVLLGRGRLDDHLLGHYRDSADVLEGTRTLHDLLRRPTGAPAIVLGAIAHAELARIAPFGFADGVLARAVEHMILIDAGVDPLGVIICEAGHRLVPEDYRRALHGYGSGRAVDVRDWILHCARALARGAEVSPVSAAR